MSSQYQTFAQWRENLDSFSNEARHTVECVLDVIESSDYNKPFNKLADLETLDLTESYITDLSPISALTNPTEFESSWTEINAINPKQNRT